MPNVLGISGLTVNLFRINPSEQRISVTFISLEDNSAINQMVHKLEDEYRCIACPKYENYGGLESGVYFICDDYSGLSGNGIEYLQKTIDSSSYIMRHFILKAIARKVQELGNSNKLFLPRDWLAYSSIMCCDSEEFMRSEPHGLFVLRPCLILRVEHISVDGQNRLFLLADSKLRRFNTLTLSKIITILLNKGINIDKINELLQKHYYSYISEEGEVYCMVKKVHEDDRAEVVIKDEVQVLPTDNIVLNPHPKFTRDFIEGELGEKLSHMERVQKTLGTKRPKHKMEDIRYLIEKLLIGNKIFPLRLGDVEYNLELTPQTIVPLGGE